MIYLWWVCLWARKPVPSLALALSLPAALQNGTIGCGLAIGLAVGARYHFSVLII